MLQSGYLRSADLLILWACFETIRKITNDDNKTETSGNLFEIVFFFEMKIEYS